MATDATGTPTSLGIPTYNVNVDAPSGNGFNAAMAEIDTLLQARAPLASPTFTGTPAAPTPAGGDNTAKIATTAFVQAALGVYVPSGSMIQYAGSSAPTGWLIADGSAISRTTYAALFAAIGTTYGAGDGSTTFNIPNLKGRVPVGLNSSGTFTTLGGSGGEETHTLSAAEMPVHSHSATFTGNAMTNHQHTMTDESGGYDFKYGTTYTATGSSTGVIDINAKAGSPVGGTAVFLNTGGASAGTPSGSVSVANAGSGSAHNNIQPYLVVNHIIKT